MQLSQFLSCGLIIILVCWLGINDAVPLGTDPKLEVVWTTTLQPKTEFAETIPITVQPIVTATPISGNGRVNKSIDPIIHSSLINQDDIEKNDGGLQTSHQFRHKDRRSVLEMSDTDNTDSNIDISNAFSSLESQHTDFEEWEIPLNKVNDNCVNEERRQNQTYTRSIPLNISSINPDDDFKIAGEPAAKKTSSVHIGEDIALCWIETTTIKEDPAFNPPKRLVIREFTISFENSASIPDSYLQCNDIEGEIAPRDEVTIRKTALHEVIDENTKRSREVNITHVSTVGRIIIRQHKKIKCGVGAVVSKDIFEWPDGTENPKKRVEIKVGPSIRDLGTPSKGKPAECSTESISRKPQAENNRKSSPVPNDETLPLCENGDCSKTVTPCEDDNCSTKSLSEETIYPSNRNELLSTGITEETTHSPNSNKLLTTSVTEETTHSPNSNKLLSTGVMEETTHSPNSNKLLSTGVTEETTHSSNSNKLLSTGVTEETTHSPNSNKLLSTGVTEETTHSPNSNKLLSTGVTEETTHSPNSNKLLSTGVMEETTHSPNSNELLSTGVTEETTTMKPPEKTMPLSHKSERNQNDPCSEFDTECISSKITTVKPQNVNEKFESCSGDDCSIGSFEGSSRENPCDKSANDSCSCSGDSCPNKKQSTSSAEDSTEINMQHDELCKNSSESCICSGSSCSAQSSEEASLLESGDKRTDKITVASQYKTNETTTTSSAGLSKHILPSKKDSNCSGESGECSVLPEFNSYENKKDTGKIDLTVLDQNSDTRLISEHSRKTEIPDSARATTLPGEIGYTPGTENVTSCDGSNPGSCSKVTPGDINSLDAISKNTEDHSSFIKDITSTERSQERLQSSSLDSNEIERPSSCAEGYEGCTSIELSTELVSPLKSIDKTTDSPFKTSETETLPSESIDKTTDSSFKTSETETLPSKSIYKTTDSLLKTSGIETLTSKYIGKTTDSSFKTSGTRTVSLTPEQLKPITTMRFNDAVSEIPTTRSNQENKHFNDEWFEILSNETDRETTIKISSTESIANVPSLDEKLFSEKRSVTECSTNSEGSSDCVQVNVTHPLGLADSSTIPSVSEKSTLHPKSCDSSEGCRSKESSSDEANDKVAGKTPDQIKTASICDDGDESCQDSSLSSKSSETCEDGSTNCRNGGTSPIPSPCDSASGSCSSEIIESGRNTMIQSTPTKFELPSTINDTVTTTAETRRSIVATTPVPSPTKGRHRLALRIKVLLEHIDENKEKEKLVQVEKHLLLNEKPSAHGNHSLMLQLQALNNSMNLETLKAIFNCSVLESLSTDVIDLDKLSKDLIEDTSNLNDIGQKVEGKAYLNKNTVVSSESDSGSRSAEDEHPDGFNDSSFEKSKKRKKREISSPINITTEVENTTDSTTIVSVENITDSTPEKAILESLPGVQEDLKNGMDHVLLSISKELGDSSTTAVNATAASSSSKILKILSDPFDSRIHSTSPKTSSRVERVMTVEQLAHPVHGEEVQRWSKERFISAADGGQIRSLTEFRILRNHSEDSRRDPSGL